MKKTLRLMRVLPFATLIFLAASAYAAFVSEQGFAPATELFEIGRFLIAGSIENREPVGIVDTFASSTEKVFCFLEARNIKEDTEVSFVWFHEGGKVATVTLPLRKGKRWRTYSSKRLGGKTGKWRVELHDAEGKILRTASFTVE